ncbi:MAG: CDP-alcohol phosphatidyltransferase family protein [Pseudonocardia sp.]|nr:CDP-alcohol phosphatidyltransferase family protein [Pseudonocardia sp.]
MPEPDAGLRGWTALHAGVRPDVVSRGWIRLVQGLAALGPVSRVPPDVLSLLGVLVVAAAWPAAAAGERWPLLAAALVVVSGVLDGLDGAVALRAGRARPLGAVVDAGADRLGDLVLVAVLGVLGAPLPLCAAVAVLVLLHEYLRARAQAAGMPGVGAVTVAERPTRVIVVAVAALGAGVSPAGTPWTGWSWAAVCAGIWAVLGAVGLIQLVLAVVRTVPARFGPDLPEPGR